MALNFKSINKSFNCFLNETKAVKRLEFSSRANQTSDVNGLKVDGNHCNVSRWWKVWSSLCCRM